MTRWLVGWGLRARVAIALLAAALLVAGLVQLSRLPADTLPEFTPPYVEVKTEALGLSAEEVEQLITVPLEADLLNGVRGVSTIRSESVPGLSSITLVFETGTDLLTARQYTQEKLTEAIGALPNVSKPHELVQPLSSQSRVMMIGLDSTKLSEIEQGVLARWTIRPRLMGVPGVANVEIWGQRERQLQVLVDPQQLKQRNVSLLQVIKTAGNAQLVSPLSFLEGSTPGTGGFFDTPNQRLGIRHVFPIARPQDLSRVKLEEAGQLQLGDVAKVVEGHQPLIGDGIVNDGSGLMLVVEKTPGANTREVTEGVDRALDDLQPGLSGLELDRGVFRPADFVDDAVANATVALLIGLLLAAIALGLLLLDWRAALVGLASIGVAIAAAALVLAIVGATINELVLAGLVLALALAVHSTLLDLGVRERFSGGGRDAGLLEALLVARGPLHYTILIALLAVVPLLLVEGAAGAILRPFVLSYALALVVSLLVALAMAPALSSLLYGSRRSPARHSVALAWLRPRYSAALTRLSAAPRPLYLATAVLVAAGIAVLPTLEQPALPALLPNFQERQLLVRFDARAGTSQPEMTRITERATHELRSLPGVRDVGGHVGRAVSGDVVGGIDRGEIWVTVGEDADYGQTVADVRELVAGYPGIHHELTTYSADRATAIGRMEDGRDDERNFKDDDVLKRVGGDFAVRVYGQSSEILAAKAAEVERMATAVDGVRAATVDAQILEPNVEVVPKLAAAERVGIKPGEIRRAAAGLLSGITVGSLFENQKVFDVIVWGTPRVRRSVGDIKELLLEAPGGRHVRLADVADVRIKATPADIRREAVARYVDVGIDVGGRDRADVVDDVRRGLQRVSFPLEYHAELIGERGERSDAFRRTLALAVAAALGVFLLIQALLGSWRLAAVLLLTLPATLAGGLIALFLDGGLLSIGAVFGLLALLPIAAHNGMELFTAGGRLARGNAAATSVVTEAAGERLAPVLAAAVASIAALLPLVLAGGVAGLEILHPMAVVLVGGLVASTLASLFLVPALYRLRGGTTR
ncbi:MAG: hypothetical protein QOJ38_1659 [Solirubrobacterales bacterium]|nr:hypothetical protein [Solirubrobacterales bacterium]